jgi:hypothetical protein
MQTFSSNAIQKLNGHKIFCIPQMEEGRMAYFVIRSWGNYLFFPHPELRSMYPFFKGQGGIYKVIDTALAFPFFNGELFRIFGAATIGAPSTYHEDFLIEKFGEEYFDPDLMIEDGLVRLTLTNLEFKLFDLHSTPQALGPNDLCQLAKIL